jgi:nucleoside 2-deoxyribosyltransferase
MRIYLAGPMAGLNYKQATDWRNDVTKELERFGVACYSPLRWKEFLAELKKISRKGTDKDVHPLATTKGIMTRDYNDVLKADVIIANFLGSEMTSMGTVMECAWAYHLNIPVIAIGEKSNPHLVHPMMMEAVCYEVRTVDDAIDIAKAILLPR